MRIVAETSDIKRRLAAMERVQYSLAALIEKISRRFRRAVRVNTTSRALTKTETDRFRKEMANHGVHEDEESNSERQP
jgi:hypothetical protein